VEVELRNMRRAVQDQDADGTSQSSIAEQAVCEMQEAGG